MPRLRNFALAALVFLPLACAAGNSAEDPGPSEPGPASSEAGTSAEARGLRRPAPSRPDRIVGQNARIAGISARTADGRVTFVVRGSLPDGCTVVRGLAVSRTDRRFDIAVWTERPEEAMCTQALVPFRREIGLDAALSPGEYTVRAGERSETFSVPRRPSGD